MTDTAWLDRNARQSRGEALKSDGGVEFSLDFDRHTVLSDGDAVRLDDGRMIQVMAAPEPLMEIRTENPMRLMRFAWHLGGRHIPAEITAEAIYIEDSPGLAEMARSHGCKVTKIMRPFDPERNEVACEHHGHHHGHGDHAHRHAHDHDHDNGHGHEH